MWLRYGWFYRFPCCFPARRALNLAQRKYATKLTIDWLPTGTRMEKYGDLVTACHNCGGREDADHIVLCPTQESNWQEALIELDLFLERIKKNRVS